MDSPELILAQGIPSCSNTWGLIIRQIAQSLETSYGDVRFSRFLEKLPHVVVEVCSPCLYVCSSVAPLLYVQGSKATRWWRLSGVPGAFVSICNELERRPVPAQLSSVEARQFVEERNGLARADADERLRTPRLWSPEPPTTPAADDEDSAFSPPAAPRKACMNTPPAIHPMTPARVDTPIPAWVDAHIRVAPTPRSGRSGKEASPISIDGEVFVVSIPEVR